MINLKIIIMNLILNLLDVNLVDQQCIVNTLKIMMILINFYNYHSVLFLILNLEMLELLIYIKINMDFGNFNEIVINQKKNEFL